MTTKADFNAEDWGKLTEAPALAGMMVIAAQRGGTVRESLAMAKVYKEAQADHPESDFIGALSRSAPDIAGDHFTSKEDMRTQGIARITEAVGIVEAQTSREELDAYRQFAMTIAERAAGADKSGGFLGIGGERVSDKESAVLDEIAAALGTQRTPPSPAS